jgi:hypothetical protein
MSSDQTTMIRGHKWVENVESIRLSIECKRRYPCDVPGKAAARDIKYRATPRWNLVRRS